MILGLLEIGKPYEQEQEKVVIIGVLDTFIKKSRFHRLAADNG